MGYSGKEDVSSYFKGAKEPVPKITGFKYGGNWLLKRAKQLFQKKKKDEPSHSTPLYFKIADLLGE